MADIQNSSIGNLTNNSKILVNVDHALENVLVVSYAFQSKLFQGVLLDSTNRYLPCAPSAESQLKKCTLELQARKRSQEIVSKGGSKVISSKACKENISSKLDQILEINKPNQENQSTPKVDSRDADKDKPFFSLCHRFTYFQDILFQRNLTVQKNTKPAKNKAQKMTVRLRPRQVLCSKCKSICNENSENVHSNKTRQSSGQPNKSPQSLPLENSQENQISSPKVRTTLIPPLSRLKPGDITNTINGTNSNESMSKWLEGQGPLERDDLFDGSAEDRQMVLRKKRSVGSMEDLWDETVFEEASKKAKTPIIKISFGSPGEGTVLKIPSKLQNCSASENEDTEKDLDVAKAFKKALKKAKKEAKRKFSLDGSPEDTTKEVSVPNQINYKKHRHKVKHKKKHKSEKGEEEGKEKCVKQKLSINLKRLTSSRTEEDSWSGDSSRASDEMPDCPASSRDSDEVPEFPPSSPLDTNQDVTSCQNDDGSTVQVGDIVWGKIHGFPWWPGKVQSLCVATESAGWDAQVSWYGSATSSLMPCSHLSPFIETFKARYNKKKKSAGYKEAIRQATSEASSGTFGVPQAPLAEINELLAL